jgi:acetylglutamate kinase
VSASSIAVVKFGGELIEDPSSLATVVSALAAVASGARDLHLVLVHGGGREIDAALRTAGIEKRQVDGLRITDAATLDTVVGVLAGLVNTRLVAALNAAGVPAVGLTGADDALGRAVVAPPHLTVDGQRVDLGHVGSPVADTSTRLLETLVDHGFVPVVACVGVDARGALLNINADTLAGHLAGRLEARRLVIAGGTPGVLDDAGKTMPELDAERIAALVTSRTATAGMIAKLRACQQAAEAGVDEVRIVDGKHEDALIGAIRGGSPERSTRVTAKHSSVRQQERSEVR